MLELGIQKKNEILRLQKIKANHPSIAYIDKQLG